MLTDLVAGRIITNIITPEFRKKRFDQEVINGIAVIIATVKGEVDTSALVNSPNTPDPRGWIIAAFAGFFFTGIIFFYRKQKVAPVVGGIYGLVLGLAAPFIETIVTTLLVAVVGMISGVIVSTMISRRGRRHRSGPGKIVSRHTGDNNSSNFGTIGGGKSGRGGDFGGEEASGD